MATAVSNLPDASCSTLCLQLLPQPYWHHLLEFGAAAPKLLHQSLIFVVVVPMVKADTVH